MVFVVGALALWVVFGFDSTWSMAMPFIENRWSILSFQADWGMIWAESQAFYGMGNHFSAPVIYGGLWILTSLYFERRGVVKSLNFCATTSLSLMNIGVFEWAWNTLYAYYQGQIWTVTWRWEQAANLFSFTVFIGLGLLVTAYMHLDGYRLRLDRRFGVLALVTLLSWTLWVYYPFEVGGLEVELVDGSVWRNSAMFPQTYYAVDVDPGDGVAVGEPNYVQNDAIHILNTWTKIVSVSAIGYLFSFKPKEEIC